MGNAFREPAGGRAPTCEGCGRPSTTSELSFTPDGRRVCRRCFATLQVAQGEARANEVNGLGAKILNPIGKAATRNPSVFIRLMLFGAIALPVVVVVALQLAFAFGDWLRDYLHR